MSCGADWGPFFLRTPGDSSEVTKKKLGAIRSRPDTGEIRQSMVSGGAVGGESGGTSSKNTVYIV